MNMYFNNLWETITIEFMLKFFVVYFFVVWIALVLWVARDIALRSTSRIFQALCVLMIIFLTPLGIFLYILIRPRRNVYEMCQEEIEENLAILWEIVHERLESNPVAALYCSECRETIEAGFIICPGCQTTLKDDCKKCKQEIRTSWETCPYCQTPQHAPVKKAPAKKKTNPHKKEDE